MPPPQTPHRVIIVISQDEAYADVTVEGKTRRVTGSGPRETRRLALDAATSYAAACGADVLIDARDATSVWQLTATPGGVVRALPASAGSEAGAAPARRRRAAIAVAGSFAALAVLAGGGIAAYRYLPVPDGGAAPDGEPAGAPSPATFDARPAPPGFSDSAEWRISMAPGARPAVSPEGTAAAFVGSDEELHVVDPDGATTWSAEFPLPPDELEGPLRFVRDEDNLRVAALGDRALWLWPTGGGTPDVLELPGGAEVTFAGGAPLVTTDEAALVPAADRLVEVRPPGGARALVYDGRAVLAAASDGRWVWVQSENGPRAVEPEVPDGAAGTGEVLTASADHTVMGWDNNDDGTVVVSVHDADDGTVVAAEELDVAELGPQARWQAAEGRGAYGPLLVDIEAGTTEILAGFAPAGAVGEVLYGELDGAEVAVGPDGEPLELRNDTARPWGLLDGRAIVVAGHGLYALPPE